MNLKPIFLPLGLVLLALGTGRAQDAFGYTEPYQEVKMAFSETGVLSELQAKEGQAVKTGDVLARLDYQVMQKDLEIARQELDLQSERVQKLDALAKDNRVSTEELKRAITDQTIDSLKVDRAAAEIESRTLRSPVDGVVIEVKRQISESVDPSSYVLRVVQLDKLLVNMYLSREAAAQFQPGAKCTLYLPDSHQKIAAQVDFVSPVTNAASNTVRVKFLIANPDGSIRSGIRCELEPKPAPATAPAAVHPPGVAPSKEPTYQ